jgi:hypothetical protein
MALGNFELDIQRFVEKANGRVDLVIRKVALEMFTRIVIKSPVDTGRARGSWSCAIGSIPSAQVNHLDKTGAATIGQISATAARVKAGEVIYLTSSLSYIRALEFGHSSQSPNGMVRLSVLEYGAVVNKAVAELPR